MLGIYLLATHTLPLPPGPSRLKFASVGLRTTDICFTASHNASVEKFLPPGALRAFRRTKQSFKIKNKIIYIHHNTGS